MLKNFANEFYFQMSTLKEQLNRLSLKHVKQSLEEVKTRPSFLYEPKEAAELDSETLYYAAINAIKDLCQRNSNLSDMLSTENVLFNETSLHLNRLMLNAAKNDLLNEQIKTVLIRLSPFFMFKSSHIIIEWLIYKFQIHWYNTEHIFACIFPYHSHNYFVRLIQICDDTDWEWLQDIKIEGVPLASSTIYHRVITDQKFFRFICELAFNSVEVHRDCVNFAHNAISFFLKTLICAIHLRKSKIKRWLIKLLPSYLYRGFDDNCAELEASCLIICSIFVKSVKLDKKVISRMLIKLTEKAMSNTRLQVVQIIIDSSSTTSLPDKCFLEIISTADEFLLQIKDPPCPAFVWCIIKSIINKTQLIFDEQVIDKALRVFEYVVNYADCGIARRAIRLGLSLCPHECSDKNLILKLLIALSQRFTALFDVELSAIINSNEYKENANVQCQINCLLKCSFAVKHTVLGNNKQMYLALNDSNKNSRVSALKQMHNCLLRKEDTLIFEFCETSLLDRIQIDCDTDVISYALQIMSDIYLKLSTERKLKLCEILIRRGSICLFKVDVLVSKILVDSNIDSLLRLCVFFNYLTVNPSISAHHSALSSLFGCAFNVNDIDLVKLSNEDILHSIIAHTGKLVKSEPSAVITRIYDYFEAKNKLFILLVLTNACCCDPENVDDNLLSCVFDMISSIRNSNTNQHANQRKRRHFANNSKCENLLVALSIHDDARIIHYCLSSLISNVKDTNFITKLFDHISINSIDEMYQCLLLQFLDIFVTISNEFDKAKFIHFALGKSNDELNHCSYLRKMQLVRMAVKNSFLQITDQDIPFFLCILYDVPYEVAIEIFHIMSSHKSDVFTSLLTKVLERRKEIMSDRKILVEIICSNVKKDSVQLNVILEACRQDERVALLLQYCKIDSLCRLLLDHIQIDKCNIEAVPYILVHVKSSIRDLQFQKERLFKLLVRGITSDRGLLDCGFDKRLRIKLDVQYCCQLLIMIFKNKTDRSLNWIAPIRKELLSTKLFMRILKCNDDIDLFISMFEEAGCLQKTHTLFSAKNLPTLMRILRQYVKSPNEKVEYMVKLGLSFLSNVIAKEKVNTDSLVIFLNYLLTTVKQESAISSQCIHITSLCVLHQNEPLGTLTQQILSLKHSMQINPSLVNAFMNLLSEDQAHFTENLYAALIHNLLIDFNHKDSVTYQRIRECFLVSSDITIKLRWNLPYLCLCNSILKSEVDKSSMSDTLLDIYRTYSAPDLRQIVSYYLHRTARASDQIADLNPVISFLDIMLKDNSINSMLTEFEEHMNINVALEALEFSYINELSVITKTLLQILTGQQLMKLVRKFCQQNSKFNNQSICVLISFLTDSGYHKKDESCKMIKYFNSMLSSNNNSCYFPIELFRFILDLTVNFNQQNTKIFLPLLDTCLDMLDNSEIATSHQVILNIIEQLSFKLNVNMLPNLKSCISKLLNHASFLSNRRLSNSYLQCISVIVKRLEGLTSPFVHDFINLCVSYPEVSMPLQQIISESIPFRILIQNTPTELLHNSNSFKVTIVLSILHRAVSLTTANEINLSFLQIRHICMAVLKCRSESNDLGNDSISSIENNGFGFIIAVVLKLSEETFLPFFTGITDWALNELEEPCINRLTSFFKLCTGLGQNLRSIFTKYAAEVLDSFPGLIEWTTKNGEIIDSQFYKAMFSCLYTILCHDQDQTVNCGTRFDLLKTSLMKKLVEKTVDKEIISDALCPCVGQLVKASSSPDCARQTILALRDGPSKSNRRLDRLNTLECVKQIAICLGNEFRFVLPEVVPILSELLEDRSDQVVLQTNTLISHLEDMLGESIQDSFVK
ncbi:hypothetical protein GJ496_001891 [Pomphorhynchus laevis]|nr:hypothetical protein GJ496_001891 [Pomphorhynchus laevis]